MLVCGMNGTTIEVTDFAVVLLQYGKSITSLSPCSTCILLTIQSVTVYCTDSLKLARVALEPIPSLAVALI